MDYCFNSLDDITLCKLIMICLRIWEARNDKVWNHHVTSAAAVVDQANIFFQEWSNINSDIQDSTTVVAHPTKWTKPPPDYLKVNVDAALDSINMQMGLGIVIRDSMGEFVAARMIPWTGRVQLESDCLQLITAIQNNDLISSFGLLVNDIKDAVGEFIDLNFSFVKRSAHMVAHTLARNAISRLDCSDCFTVPFPFLSHVLNSNRF
ncbi:PREDICTED: uncharacterized protein LOC109168295 [Ipomoea nil]|uniref:uncharacterized protein LOC109168295 n=1 Tax=Ipomoea nil TaxID=35883 RepID=UPI0009012091|nr:PREDICTED: uncharacterized protein LOC109168295 [Ipomoea nil]